MKPLICGTGKKLTTEPETEFLDKSLKSFLPCSSNGLYSPPPPPPQSKCSLKLVCNVNIVYGNLKSANSQDYTEKPRRKCTFMNSASVRNSQCAFDV